MSVDTSPAKGTGATIDATTAPPLDLIALFAPEIPRQLELAVDGGHRFKAVRASAPFGPLAGHLLDMTQPLSPSERDAASRAQAIVHLRCDAAVAPAERLPSALMLIDRCLDAGALAIVLPAAYKIVGRSFIEALDRDFATATGWLRLFLHEFIASDDRYAWTHTHGMEHFGLPDLECRTLVEQQAVARRLIAGGIHQLMEHGEESFHVDDLMEATEDDGSVAGRFYVRPHRAVPDHGYGFYGCIQLVPAP